MKKIFLVLFLLTTACKSKSSACAKVNETFDPIAKELDAVVARSTSAAPPSPGDQASCAQLTEEIRHVEGAQAKLALVITDDATLSKGLDAYRKHVDAWAKSAHKAQAACLTRDGNAMTAALSESIQHRSQLGPAKNDIGAYCKAP